MTKRIFQSILIVSIVAFLSCAVILPFFLYSYFETVIGEELQSEAELLAAGVEKYGEEFLNSIEENVYIRYCDSSGNELYKTGNWQESDGVMTRSETVEAQLSDGSRVVITVVYGTALAIILSKVGPLALVFALVIGFSVFLAKALSRNIVQPINSIDLEDPQIKKEYIEISPLLHRIKRQNDLINMQMKDLRHRQQEFEAITENMGEGLIVVDRNGEILTHNRSANEFFGSDSIDYGCSIYTLDMGDELENAVKKALEGERCEFELDAEDKVFQVFTSPVKTSGKGSGALIFVFDITEKAQRDSMRKEFTSNVSHELKTPLTSIYGISEIMMNGIVKPEDVAGFAENIHNEAGRLISLVNDIIKLSQLDENSIPMEKEPVDLLLVAKEVKTRLRHVIEKSGVDFKLIGESAVVPGVSKILSEMIYNLCDNAIKYNKKNGTVELTVGVRRGAPYVRVKDTGIGIPQSAQSRVFERFFRVDKSHSKEIGGTGLGLSIVKHGAAYHNAEVTLESKLNEGTTVEIVFEKLSDE